MPTNITTWYLEMQHPSQFRPAFSSNPHLSVVQAEIPCPEFSRFFYTSVGGDWQWTDRLTWTRDRWMAYLDRPDVQTWVGYLSGTPIGYVELEAQPDRAVEIAYFGLLPQFTGQGLGKHLLSIGVQQAWQLSARRVWVHTCSLDSPYALANYQARGFQIYKEETHSVESDKPLPADSSGAS